MRQDKDEIDVVYLSDGETWDLAENCTIVFRAIYDKSQNLALPGQDSMQIYLRDLIPLAHQAIRNKSIKVFRLTALHKSRESTLSNAFPAS